MKKLIMAVMLLGMWAIEAQAYTLPIAKETRVTQGSTITIACTGALANVNLKLTCRLPGQAAGMTSTVYFITNGALVGQINLSGAGLTTFSPKIVNTGLTATFNITPVVVLDWDNLEATALVCYNVGPGKKSSQCAVTGVS